MKRPPTRAQVERIAENARRERDRLDEQEEEILELKNLLRDVWVEYEGSGDISEYNLERIEKVLEDWL